MNNVLEFLKGKKTYIACALIAVIAGLLFAGVTVPDSVWAILGFAGLGFIRAAVAGVTAAAPTGSFFSGKKTYIVCAVGGILAGLQAYGIVIPEFVFVLLSAVGMGTLRSSITKVQ